MIEITDGSDYQKYRNTGVESEGNQLPKSSRNLFVVISELQSEWVMGDRGDSTVDRWLSAKRANLILSYQSELYGTGEDSTGQLPRDLAQL